jgi:hypothetical protein
MNLFEINRLKAGPAGRVVKFLLLTAVVVADRALTSLLIQHYRMVGRSLLFAAGGQAGDHRMLNNPAGLGRLNSSHRTEMRSA